MTKQKRTRYQIIGVISLSLIIAAVSYGFAAAKPNYSNVGIFGADYGVLSPYEVTKLNYILDLDDPTTFTAVEFVINGEDVVTDAGISASKNGQITWAEGCEKSGVFWTCSFAENTSVLEADWLHLK